MNLVKSYNGQFIAILEPNIYYTDTKIHHSIKIIESEIENINVVYKDPRIIDNVHDRLISFEKLNNHTDWSPKYDIEDGIRKTIEYFKKK